MKKELLKKKRKLVREMHEVGYSMRGIAKKLNIARETIRKYLKPDATAIHATYGTKKEDTLLAEYVDEINEYITSKLPFKQIEVRIRNYLNYYVVNIQMYLKF